MCFNLISVKISASAGLVVVHVSVVCTCLGSPDQYFGPLVILFMQELPCTNTCVCLYMALDLLHILYMQEYATEHIIHLALINGFNIHFQTQTMCVYEFYQSTVINSSSVLC